MQFPDDEMLAILDEWVIDDLVLRKQVLKEGAPDEVKEKWEEWQEGFKRFKFLDRSGKSGNKE